MGAPDKVSIPVEVNAAGVGPGVATAAAGLKQIETSTNAAAAAARSANAATKESAAATAAAAPPATQLDNVVRTLVAHLRDLGMSNQTAARAAYVLAQGAVAAKQPIEQVSDRLERLGVIAPKALTDANVAMRETGVAATAMAAEEDVAALSAEELAAANAEASASMMKNAFYTRRLAEGFKDLSLGGRATGQAMMDISESLQYMLGPEAAVAIAGLQVVAMLAMLLTSHRHNAEAAKEHAEQEKSVAEALKDVAEKGTQSLIDLGNEAGRVHLDVVNAQLRQYITAQQQIEAQQERWAQNAAKRRQWAQDEAEAVQKLTLAQMENAKQLELNAAHTKEQRDVIEAKYKARELDVKGADLQGKHEAEQAAIAAQVTANDKERGALVDQNIDRQKKLDDLRKDASAKARTARQDGFAPDESGSFEGAIKQQEEALKQARAAQFNAHQTLDKTVDDHKLALAMPGPAGDVARLAVAAARQAAETSDDKATQASHQLADLRDAENARKAYLDGGKELTDAMKANTDEINKLVIDREGLTHQAAQENTDFAAEQQQQQTEKAQADAEAAKQKAKDDYDVRQARRENAKDAQQAVLDDPNASADAKAKAKAAMDKLDAAGEQDQLDNADALELSQAERIRLQGKVGLDNAKAGDALAAGGKKDARAQIENLTGQIEATGNKGMIEAMHRVLDVFKGKSDEQSQMYETAQLMLVLAGQFTDFAQQQRTINRQTKQRLDQHEHNRKNDARN